MGLSYNHGLDQNLGFCPFLILILLAWWRYKSFTLSRSYTKWENHLLLSYWEDGFQKFPATNLINAARMTKPIIFKPKNICLWDTCVNLDFVGKVVEVILARGRTTVRGYWFVQATDVKNQSTCSRSEVSCILLQV